MIRILIIFLFPLAGWADTIEMNGKTYICDGKLTVSSGGASCDGKRLMIYPKVVTNRAPYIVGVAVVGEASVPNQASAR
jgi:hypothetical protein